MPDLDDVDRMARSLPEVTAGERHGNRTWFVGGKGFVWERPFTKADLARMGADPVPAGSLIAARVADADEKNEVLAGVPGAFTISHFNGYNAVLLRLEAVSAEDLEAVITDGWRAMAPPRTRRLLEAGPGR